MNRFNATGGCSIGREIEDIMSDNPDDAILKTIAITCVGVIVAPFVFVTLKVIDLGYWLVGKVMGE